MSIKPDGSNFGPVVKFNLALQGEQVLIQIKESFGGAEVNLNSRGEVYYTLAGYGPLELIYAYLQSFPPQTSKWFSYLLWAQGVEVRLARLDRDPSMIVYLKNLKIIINTGQDYSIRYWPNFVSGVPIITQETNDVPSNKEVVKPIQAKNSQPEGYAAVLKNARQAISRLKQKTRKDIQFCKDPAIIKQLQLILDSETPRVKAILDVERARLKEAERYQFERNRSLSIPTSYLTFPIRDHIKELDINLFVGPKADLPKADLPIPVSIEVISPYVPILSPEEQASSNVKAQETKLLRMEQARKTVAAERARKLEHDNSK